MVKGILQVVLILVSLTLFITGNPFAQGKLFKDTGRLTSVEADGSVIIDENGYEIDPFENKGKLNFIIRIAGKMGGLYV